MLIYYKLQVEYKDFCDCARTQLFIYWFTEPMLSLFFLLKRKEEIIQIEKKRKTYFI